MIRRLWHLLFWHNWRERDVVFNEPTNPDMSYLCFGEHNYHEKYGFTDITTECTCGALRTRRLVGKHETSAEAEIKKLREWAGL